jgi:hypothetical protein
MKDRLPLVIMIDAGRWKIFLDSVSEVRSAAATP